MSKQTPVMGVEITGWGAALPEEAVSNIELISRYGLDSSDEKIRELTGIENRYICNDSENLLTLSVAAARNALNAAGIVAPYEVDKLILATTTSYRELPGTHPGITRELGLQGSASVEMNTACTGFVTALVDAYRHFPVDGVERMVVVGGDTLSVFTDYTDRSTAMLFGDGAGAVVMERGRDTSGLLGWAESVDGDAEDILYCERGGKVQMDGREVFRRATHAIVDIGHQALERAGVAVKEVDLVVPHQANLRIIDFAAKKFGVDMDKMVVTIAQHGNTSSASIPLALNEALANGRIDRGDKILLVGFGAGMTAAAALIEW
jgi:3-oxoacyl-[acyl-carrier-protein] synthase-3